MSGADERRSERSNVVLMGSIHWENSQVQVRISNLSAHGVLIIGDDLPGPDTQVMFHCGEFSAPGWIAWSRDRHAGVHFEQPIDPQLLLRRAGVAVHAVPLQYTKPIDVRRPGFRGNQLTPEEQKVLEEWQRGESGTGV